MKKFIYATAAVALMAGPVYAGDRSIDMVANPEPALLGKTVRLSCEGIGDWKDGRIRSGRVSVWNAADHKLVDSVSMSVSGRVATYDYSVAATENIGRWDFECRLSDGDHSETSKTVFLVATAGSGGGSGGTNPVTAHQSIQSYEGPATCIACHLADAEEMLGSLHMKWSGPTPELSNTNGEELGKAVAGINTFCTYAMSSKGACFTCHVRADGNAPHAPDINDVDCLMCHNDTYQRKFVPDPDPDNALTVTNVLGEIRTYVFGAQDAEGNYTTVPDYSLMPPGTTMLDLARNVHKPTRKSCLRCHAKAGGGDWTKRGDMGLNSVSPTVDQDVHMSPDGANLSCTACHATSGHLIGGRGIDLRQTEAPDPACKTCHSASPHSNSTLNRHAGGQVACQVCHIRTYAKGGATEMSRDWLSPVWNPAFCGGQGGFVGHEVKLANVKPEYRWFDGTSYVYNIGETIQPNADGTYTMARANGGIFDGKSKIVPIKDHWSLMPLHESGKIVPPAIMWMFMTGDFDQAVQVGMQEEGMTGSYSMVDTNAEMLITHGVEPKEKAPVCSECHASSGITPDGTGLLPFAELGYHTWPAKVKSCTLCHSSENMSWTSMHDKHVRSEGLKCTMCHTTEPTGLVKPKSDLCNDCHSSKSWSSSLHKKHVEKGYTCSKCHTF